MCLRAWRIPSTGTCIDVCVCVCVCACACACACVYPQGVNVCVGACMQAMFEFMYFVLAGEECSWD